MRNWSPEPFHVDPDDVVRTSAASDGFVRASPADTATVTADRCEAAVWVPSADLRDEAKGPTEPAGRSLTDQISEADLRAAFAAELAALETAHAAETARCREEARANLAAWTAGFAAAEERRRSQDAPRLAALAVAMAAKIVRAAVAADPAVLTATIETVLFKIERDTPLTVTVHPEDAAWLEDHPDTVADLRIGEIVADRRVTRGGCRVQAAGREWDASLESQLQALSDAATAALEHGKGEHHGP